jgi:hypothetical protein
VRALNHLAPTRDRAFLLKEFQTFLESFMSLLTFLRQSFQCLLLELDGQIEYSGLHLSNGKLINALQVVSFLNDVWIEPDGMAASMAATIKGYSKLKGFYPCHIDLKSFNIGLFLYWLGFPKGFLVAPHFKENR